MRRLMVLFLILSTIIAMSFAQLNFSTGWGKRASNASPNGGSNENCKTSVEVLMLIYKLIQNEAQRVFECNKFTNDK
ncbi:hypertrehalosaemic prohormone-like [Agrilus planipennis]|uniref:Hypertrehalosaemic prohormone-like n=1 Tax=Agrilus planipennis TaxID=224129 RepID=A0A7F5RFK5_AGRPL|nr:hypertrehalosaemic prohormone-like [Agrilus planipennis]